MLHSSSPSRAPTRPAENIPVTIYLVDDEPDVVRALTWLLDSVKLPSRGFSSPSAFLEALSRSRGAVCAVLDLRMPELSGLELMQRMNEEGYEIPVLFLTAHGDVPAAVHAMQLGAIDFLQKPFNSQSFLDAVNHAIRIAWEGHERRTRNADFEVHLKKLSPRERDVLNCLVRGGTSKEIARNLGISPKTVDVHRANIMRKLEVSTYGGLIQKYGEVLVGEASPRH